MDRRGPGTQEDRPCDGIYSQQLVKPRHFAKRRRCSWLLAMDSLAVVVEKLGIADTWPSCVLTGMFYEEPEVRFSKRVAAILYGTGLG